MKLFIDKNINIIFNQEFISSEHNLGSLAKLEILSRLCYIKRVGRGISYKTICLLHHWKIIKWSGKTDYFWLNNAGQ